MTVNHSIVQLTALPAICTPTPLAQENAFSYHAYSSLKYFEVFTVFLFYLLPNLMK